MPAHSICLPGRLSQESQHPWAGLRAESIDARRALAPRSDREDRTIDETIKGRIEAEFKRQKRFRIAATLDQADYVFLTEATFILSMSARAGGTTPDDEAENLSMPVAGDGQLNAMTSIVALAMPAGTSGRALDTARRAWGPVNVGSARRWLAVGAA